MLRPDSDPAGVDAAMDGDDVPIECGNIIVPQKAGGRAKASLKPKTVSDSPGQFCKLPGIGAYGARCFSPDPELLQAQGIQAADSASKIAPTCMLVAFFRTTLGALKVICEPLSIVP